MKKSLKSLMLMNSMFHTLDIDAKGRFIDYSTNFLHSGQRKDISCLDFSKLLKVIMSLRLERNFMLCSAYSVVPHFPKKVAYNIFQTCKEP